MSDNKNDSQEEMTPEDIIRQLKEGNGTLLKHVTNPDGSTTITPIYGNDTWDGVDRSLNIFGTMNDVLSVAVNRAQEVSEKNGFDDIKILYNNAFKVGKIAVCGTRGWMFEDTQQDEKIKQREAGRFLRSAEEAVKTGLEPVAFLHYPPVFGDEISENMLEVLHRFNIKRCYYGHLHGAASAQKALNGEFEGIKFRLTSCDTVGFCPVLVEKF